MKLVGRLCYKLLTNKQCHTYRDMIDSLPTVEALAMVDHRGRSCIPQARKPAVLYDVEEETIDMANTTLDADELANGSDGEADAVLKEGATMKNRRRKTTTGKVVNLTSEDSDDDSAIVYSISGSSVQRTQGYLKPQVTSICSVVVKIEPKSPRAPNSPL